MEMSMKDRNRVAWRGITGDGGAGAGLVLALGIVLVASCLGESDDGDEPRGAGETRTKHEAVLFETPAPAGFEIGAAVRGNLANPMAAAESATVATQPYGTIPAASAVTSDGEFTYDVALKLPPGRAGLQPSVGLRYGSRSGNGALGIGWTVSGLSVIERCKHTVSRDGAAGGLDFHPDFNVRLNQYCLDRVKLVPTGERSGSVVIFTTEAAAGIRLLYGGSVKPGNAAEIFAVADVDGALVGGASLEAESFGAIVAAAGAA